MFKNTLRATRDLAQRTMLSVQVPVDNDGYFDRKCPASTCMVDFKVKFDDWKNIVTDEQVFCPVCRHEAESGEWDTAEQVEYIKSQALAYLQGRITSALQKDAREFNRKQPRSSFIKLSLNVKPATLPVTVPPEALEVMQQQFVCENCNCRYASIGTAFFCPACGHNSAIRSFETTVATVRATLAALPTIKQTLTLHQNKDAAENTARQIIEDSFCRLVSAFQKYAEASFTQHPNAHLVTIKKNVFQRLDDSSTLWQQATGKSYIDMIGQANLDILKALFQKRHLLAHVDGIIDQEYITKSRDASLKVGQRLVIRDSDVHQLADLVSLAATEIKMLV
jgi:hypothetical protein